MKSKTKKLYDNLYESHGEDYQLQIIQEELAETVQAVSKYARYRMKQKNLNTTEGELEEIVDHLSQELADVKLTTEGLIYKLGIEDKVSEYHTMKLERTEQRAKKYFGEDKWVM